MDLDSLAVVVQAALSPNSDERTAAEQRLNEFQCTPLLLLKLLQIVVDNKQVQPMTIGQSTKRPPLFTGSNCFYWKARMKVYIKALDYDIWSVVADGPNVPSKIVNGRMVPKEENEWEESDRKLIQVNAQAMHILYCSLVENEFIKIASCDSAKEIWDTLEVIYEGTKQVKQSKIRMLERSYESFEMKSNESISEMFTRFTHITNVLKFLDSPHPNDEMVRKILWLLPKNWDVKVAAILESKDLTKYRLEELIGSLLTYEMQLKQREEEGKRKKDKAVKIYQED